MPDIREQVIQDLVARIDALREDNLRLRLQVGGCAAEVADAIVQDVREMRESAKHALRKAQADRYDRAADRRTREALEARIARLKAALMEAAA